MQTTHERILAGLQRGRQLQTAILAAGGPRPEERDRFLRGVALLDRAERAVGEADSLGLLPLALLSWIGAGVAALSGVYVAYKVTSAAGQVIDESVPALLKMVGWVLVGSLAWAAFNVGKAGRSWWTTGVEAPARARSRPAKRWAFQWPITRRPRYDEDYDEGYEE